MARLYRGFSSFEFQSSGSFQLSDVELVKMDLLNHIFTRRGERVMMPRFGTSIPDMTFEMIDEFLIDDIYEELENVFDYDPRVEIVELQVTPIEDENMVHVSATLNFIELNLVDNMNINIDFNEG
jgi:phage baseplate assembly protein W